VIVSERGLERWEKSIKPVNIGGVAGGEKYIVAGILFKFSSDVELAPGNWMYGGKQRDDEAAHKAAGHERKGIEVLMKRSPSEVIVPLMTLVDFRGCRLSAQALLPLNGLVYGSNDAGKTIHCAEKSPDLNGVICKLGEDLNLAKHKVMERNTGVMKEICFPVDIEIHKCATNPRCCYIIDTARLMPPQTPSPQNPREVFYKLFRPEFVSTYEKPLSSDAFSSFGLIEREKQCIGVIEATKELTERTIPKIAQLMSANDAQHVTRYLQQRGVNVRYLGKVRSHAKDETVRHALLLEMIARVIHKRINLQWRHVSGFEILPSVKVALNIINEALTGKANDWIKEHVLKKFGEEALDGGLKQLTECVN
jgi:Clustered mitochondria/Translation initiation factor eIF3 subunit 135